MGWLLLVSNACATRSRRWIHLRDKPVATNRIGQLWFVGDGPEDVSPVMHMWGWLLWE